MRFSCQAGEMTEALSIVTRALSARTTMPILEGILLESAENGLRLTCSDGAMTITTTIPATFEENGAVVLPGRLFNEIMRKQSAGEAVFTVNDRLAVTVKCLGSRTTLSGKPADQFPSFPIFDVRNSVSLPGDLLKDMIRDTSFAVATDENRMILTGCLLEIAQGEARMVALDGFRIALKKSEIAFDVPEMSAVIPGRLLAELSKLLDGEEMALLTFGENQLRADIGNVRVYASLLEGEFIKYWKIIPKEFKTKVTVTDREQLAMCVDRASLMARESKTNLIKLSIKGGEMVITSNSEIGDVYEEIQIEQEGEDLDIAFNVKYITDVLRVLDCESLTMKFNSSTGLCVMEPVDNQSYMYMVLPVRLSA